MPLYIESLGHGPDLVLVHGWAMNCDVFAPLVDRLAGEFRVHLLDLPGHGRNASNPRILSAEAVAQSVQGALPDAVWIGWSLGGVIALEIAIRGLLPIQGLALIGCSPSFVRRADWEHGVDLAVFEQFGHELLIDYERTLQRFLAIEVIGTATAQEDLRALTRIVFNRGKPALRVLEEGLLILENSDLRPGLSELEIPIEWIGGARDRLVPASAMRTAAAACRHSHFHELRGAGHAPFLSHADQVAAIIRSLAHSASRPMRREA